MIIGTHSQYSAIPATSPGSTVSIIDEVLRPTEATETNTSIEPSTSATGDRIDFRNATRKQLFDWMNHQLRTGQMTLDESTPFLAMTVKFSATGRPVEMATDTMPVNFVERARLGVEGALSRFDGEGAERLRGALATMLRHEAQTPRLDALV